jgi:hypothetical protein
MSIRLAMLAPVVGGLALLVVSLLRPPSTAAQTTVCLSERSEDLPKVLSSVRDLGVPNAEGVTIQEQLQNTGDPFVMRAYKFSVPEGRPSAAFVYVGDQWYDLDLALYAVSANRSIACWQTTGARARSERAQTRAIQLIRPDEQIIEELAPGDYILLVGVEVANSAMFDASKPFTVRVALTPKICALNPSNVPSARYPGLKERAGDSWYQVGVAYEPPEAQLGPFTLMTFSALVSPPYLDLFDFRWEVDGKPAGGGETTLQVAVPGLTKTPDNKHRVKLTAIGARQYPDPDQPHIPLADLGGSVAVECTFTAK